MVMRCSLLGHDYGDPDVEREREERGSEVVVTVREYETCARCGNENVLSENTEVTSLSTAADADEPESTPDATGADAEFADAGASDREAADTAPAEVDSGASDGEPTEGDGTDEPADGDDIGIPTDEDGEPITDDAEILENDATESTSDRGRGEWPESEDVGPPVGSDNDPAEWPDEPAGTDPVEDDAVLLEDEPTADAATTAETEPVADSAPAADSDAEPGTGIERAESAPVPGDENTSLSENVPTEFYCPRCEYVAAGDQGSLRPGDICPDCRKGYLGERQRR